MILWAQKLRSLAKAMLPTWAFRTLRPIWRSIYKGPSNEKIFRWQSRRLFKIERNLLRYPHILRRHHIQVVRSLELRGISDNVIEEANKDIMNFTWDNSGRPVFDVVRIPSMIESVLFANELDGEVAECGVFHGSSAKIIRHFASLDKTLYLFDTFTGFTVEDREIEAKLGTGVDPGNSFADTNLEFAKSTILSRMKGKDTEFGEDSVVFFPGSIKETLHNVEKLQFSLVHLDLDLYEPTKIALRFFIPRIVNRGLLLLNDYAVDRHGYSGVYKAIMESEFKEMAGPLPFGDTSTALFIKTI